MEVSVTTLDLLRHGACDDDCHLRGHTDSPLSEAGWGQMLKAVNQWPQADQWENILTSPLQRCQVFAEKLAQHKKLPSYTLETLKEMHFGRWDGLSLADLQAHYEQDYLTFWQQPESITPPDGEAVVDFHSRVGRALQQILQLHRGQHCLVVTHGGVMRSAIGTILKQPLSHLNRLNIGYASFCQIQVFHHPDHPDWFQLNQLQPVNR